MAERTGLFKQRYSRFFTLRAPCGRCLRFLTVASARTIGSHQVHPLRARYKKGPPLASLFLYLWRSGRDSIWHLTHWFIRLKYQSSSLMPPFVPPQTTAWGAIFRVGINFCSLTLGETKPLHRRLEIHCPALHQLVYTPEVFNYSKKFGRIETLGKKQCNP